MICSNSTNTVLLTSRAGFLVQNLSQYTVFHFFLLPTHLLLLFLVWTLASTSLRNHTNEHYFSSRSDRSQAHNRNNFLHHNTTKQCQLTSWTVYRRWKFEMFVGMKYHCSYFSCFYSTNPYSAPNLSFMLCNTFWFFNGHHDSQLP